MKQEKKTSLLVVEDDRELADMIRDWFGKRDFHVTVCGDGRRGLREAEEDTYDAIILDVMLPGMDGFTVLETLRKEQIGTPVLVLTARGDLEDRLRGFSCGAQDYLAKPFAIQELEARVRVLSGKRVPAGLSGNQVMTCGDLVLDSSVRELSCRAKSVQLSGREYDLMECFMKNQGRILSKEQITEAVWGYDSDAGYNQEEVYISFLRRKFRYLGTSTQIVTRRGAGYVLQAGES